MAVGFRDGRLAGDDTGQGQNLSLRSRGIQHVTLYRYR